MMSLILKLARGKETSTFLHILVKRFTFLFAINTSVQANVNKMYPVENNICVV